MSRQRLSLTFGVATAAFVALLPACSGGGCGKSNEQAAKPAEATKLTHGLTPDQAKQVLIKVGDSTITVGDFAERLAELSPYLRARYNSPERRREFLDNMVRFELLAIAAREKGLDNSPDVVRTRKEVMVQKLMEQLFDENGLKPAEVTEADIKAYYDANQSEFSKPEQVRASHILIKNRATAERVLKEAIAAGTDAEKFRQLAKQHNEDAETKARFGDLRFFSRPEHKEPSEPNVPDAVRVAAFSIAEVGGIHPQLVQGDRGFHIIKLTGKRAALTRSLDDARRLIQNRMWRERREQAVEKFIAELRAKANVEEHLEQLSQVKVQPGVGGPGMDGDQGHGGPSDGRDQGADPSAQEPPSDSRGEGSDHVPGQP